MVIKKWIILGALLTIAIISLSYIRSKPHYKHEFAVCAMFKNEAPWLKEWIDYHHDILGATHFYLYNNDSTDHYQKVLLPYIEQGLVELIDWKSCEENKVVDPPPCWQAASPWDDYQAGAYNDCLKKRALGIAQWVAVIDIDEYIVPAHGAQSFCKLLKKYSEPSLRSILKKLKNPFRRRRSFGSLQLNWLVFGTSNVWDISSTELLIEKLYLRAPEDYPANELTKCIYRPEAIDVCCIHYGTLKKEYKVKELPIADFRINHYWSGPEKKLIEKRQFSKEQLVAFAKECNVEDKTIFQSLKQMKINLFEDPGNTCYGAKIKTFKLLGDKITDVQLLRDLITSNFASLTEATEVSATSDCLVVIMKRSPYERVKETFKNCVFIDYDLLCQYPAEWVEYLVKKYNLKKSRL